MKYFFLSFLVFASVHAEIDKMVRISGKIGNVFDDSRVKVTDAHDQTYYLPRNVFPKDLRMEDGKMFSIEVDQAVLKDITLIKKK